VFSIAGIQFVAMLAQTPTSQASASSLKVQSIMDFLIKGGPVMIPIGLCSLIALAVFVERLVSLRRKRIIPAAFLAGLKRALNGGSDRREALEYCRTDASPVANVFAAGIKRLGEPIDLLEKHIQEAGEREVQKLHKNLRALSLISSVSTLLGLLGTILGLINAFEAVAISAEALGKTELLAKGIYEAMITTAAGLFVAIPTVIAYHYLAAKIERLVAEMDRMSVDFIEEYAAPVRSDMLTPDEDMNLRLDAIQA
jgi:biopolymer transport protein ExbB